MFNYDSSTGEIWLYDAIGPSKFWDIDTGMIDAALVNEALTAIGPSNRVLLRINSPGGYVDEAVPIFNLLERHPGGVDVAIDSLAASAASFIALAGDKITIAKNAMVMVHGPQGGVMGSEKDIRAYADILTKYAQRLEPMYVDKTGQSAEQVAEWMAGEFWFTATEAVDAGLATEIGNAVPTARTAIVPKALFKNTPAAFLKRDDEQPVKPTTHVRDLAAVANKQLRAKLLTAR